jgi:hypothetical protein
MNRRAILASALVGQLMGCTSLFKTVSYKYRFKFSVIVDGAQHVGESVIRIVWRDRSGDFGNTGAQFGITCWAEAAIADLGPTHGLLFALLRKPERGDLFYPAYVFPRVAVSFFEQDDRYGALQRLAKMQEEVSLPPSEWPLFVRFRDLQAPASIEEVSPSQLADVYGAGARIHLVSMQVTDAPVTRRIRSVLPWLQSLETSLSGKRVSSYSGSIADQLGPLNFLWWGL